MADTDCRKCKRSMPTSNPIKGGVFSGLNFVVTGYMCDWCGHWNDLKRRKANNEQAKETTP